MEVFRVPAVLALVNLAGVMACGVGFFITFPVMFAALMYAYEDITGTGLEGRVRAKTAVSEGE